METVERIGCTSHNIPSGKAPKSLKTVKWSTPIHFVISRSCVRVTPPAPECVDKRCDTGKSCTKVQDFLVYQGISAEIAAKTRALSLTSGKRRTGGRCTLQEIRAFRARTTSAAYDRLIRLACRGCDDRYRSADSLCGAGDHKALRQ